MSLHRVDARFLLPHPVRTAFVAGADGWADGLRAAGVEVLEPPGRVDLFVASSGHAEAAPDGGSEMVILEGRSATRTLRRAGYAATRILPLPTVASPVLLLPLDHPSASAYAVEHWTAPQTVAKRVRKYAVQALLERGTFPPLRPTITVGVRQGRLVPFILQHAHAFDVPLEAEWFLVNRPEYELGRGLFVVFPPHSRTPAWAVKFARTAGYAEPFERDEQGLRLAAACAPGVAARAPRLLGRFEVNGLHASVESAAVGRRLDSFLAASTRSGAMSLELIDRVAGWVADLARSTLASADHGVAERGRLRNEIVPPWAKRGVPGTIVDDVAEVPVVVQHNDLGCWNIVTDGTTFTAVDWESARRYGLPLWDLWYFLTDALATADGAVDAAARKRHFVRLFRGELTSSRILFGWMRELAETLGLSTHAIGPLATLCWLHHARSHDTDVERVRRHAPHASAPAPLTLRLPELWLGEPGLGASWDVWRG